MTKIEEYAFYECRGLTSVKIPNGVTEIEQDVFRGCANLTSVTIPNGVKEIDFSAFFETNLKSIELPDSAESFNVDFGGLPDVITYKGKIYTGHEFYDIVTRGKSFDNSDGQTSSQNPDHANEPLSGSTCPRCGRILADGETSCDCTWCDICNAWMLGHGHEEG